MKYIKQSFEEYMQEVFAEHYTGLDDDMPDRYEGWIERFELSETMEYAERYGEKLHNHYRNEINTILETILDNIDCPYEKGKLKEYIEKYYETPKAKIGGVLNPNPHFHGK